MNFKDFYLITEGDIYKTTYESTQWGGGNIVGLTIEFVDLIKNIDGPDNIHWSWNLILDGKEDVTIWSDEDNRGRQYDGGCYYVTEDEYGNNTLDKPVDWERREAIEEYIKKEWPLEKREAYVHKKDVMKGLKGTATDTWNDILG